MKQGATLSAVLHAVVIVIAYFGVPHLFDAGEVPNEPVPVDVVTIAPETKAPPPEPKAEAPEPTPPKKEPPKARPSEPPPPAPPLEVAEPPQPKVPEPAPEPEPAPPEPEVAKLEPEPEPEPIEAPRPVHKPRPPAPPPPRPEKKAEAEPRPDAFTSVLKTVEKLKRTAQAKEEEEKPVEEPEFKPVIKARPTTRLNDLSSELTISEKDAIRRQIERCWNVPAGARNAEDLVVEIRVAVNPDGTIRHAKIVDSGRMQTDSFFRAAAESALRAVLNPRCSPLELPAEKYDRWKTMTLKFNPREILGG